MHPHLGTGSPLPIHCLFAMAIAVAGIGLSPSAEALAQGRESPAVSIAQSSQAFLGVWSAKTNWPGDGVVEISVDAIAANGTVSGRIRIPQRTEPRIVEFSSQPDIKGGFFTVVQGSRLTIQATGGGTYALEMVDDSTLAGEYHRLQLSPPIRTPLTFKKMR